MRTKMCVAIVGVVLALAMTVAARAHFGAIIPSDDMVSKEERRTLGLSVTFFHPFEGHYMEMARPAQFACYIIEG